MSKKTISEQLSSPLSMQAHILDEFEAKFASGEEMIVDGNSPFGFLLEAMTTITSTYVRSVDNKMLSMYAKRAQTSQDLYKHMSDFDYLNMFSSPASIMMNLVLDRKYLIDNAEIFNMNYKKVVIPKETTISIGSYKFGLFYPIEIKINRLTDTILVTYDTTIQNPLYQLKDNTLKVTEYDISELKLIAMQVPVHQFSKVEYIEDIPIGSGFSKKFDYADKFYAVRVFTLLNDKWTELSQTLSDEIYNSSKATARIVLETETNKVKVIIPQVYINNNLIGNKLKVEVYTTLGALDTDIRNIPLENINVNFGFDTVGLDVTYSKILENIPTIQATPIDTKIVGGSNGYEFEELKERVVNNSLYGDVLITPANLKNFFTDKGFNISKHIDNITDRIYFCYRTLTDKLGSTIPAASLPTKIDSETIENVETIINHHDGLITILPTTLYRYNDSELTCEPVLTSDIRRMNSMGKEERISEYNKNNFTKSPFHIVLNTDARYPTSTSYNLMAPQIDAVIFKKENINVAAQMIANGAIVIHNRSGAGGFTIRFAVKKSKEFDNIPDSDVVVYFLTKTANNLTVGGRASKVGTSEGDDIYELDLATEYRITPNGHIYITSLTEGESVFESPIPLDNDFDVVFMAKKQYFNLPNNADADLYAGVPLALLNEYTCLTRQTFNVHLGHSLDDVIYGIVDTRWTPKEYKTHKIVEYHTYQEDVYVTNPDGSIKVDIDPDGELITYKIHQQGDLILDDFGNPRIKHNIGDLVLDANGKPIIEKNRVVSYRIEMLQIDAKMYVSNHPTQVNYIEELPKQLDTYFNTIFTASEQLIENTRLYFKPTRTIGTALFEQGDGYKIRQPLALEFRLKCYVPEFVAKDISILDIIRSTIAKTIDTAIGTSAISMSKIATMIMSSLPDYIKHVDVLGINGSVDLQTIIIVDQDTRPSLAKELYVTTSGTIAMRDKVLIEFVTDAIS